jgi:hypothetical protein
MPIEISYTCDQTGKPCDDTTIIADTTGTTQRVILDATIYHRTTDGTVTAQAMGQHVFASIADALAWAHTITLP